MFEKVGLGIPAPMFDLMPSSTARNQQEIRVRQEDGTRFLPFHVDAGPPVVTRVFVEDPGLLEIAPIHSVGCTRLHIGGCIDELRDRRVPPIRTDHQRCPEFALALRRLDSHADDAMAIAQDVGHARAFTRIDAPVENRLLERWIENRPARRPRIEIGTEQVDLQNGVLGLKSKGAIARGQATNQIAQTEFVEEPQPVGLNRMRRKRVIGKEGIGFEGDDFESGPMERPRERGSRTSESDDDDVRIGQGSPPHLSSLLDSSTDGRAGLTAFGSASVAWAETPLEGRLCPSDAVYLRGSF
jgi:hypothetical protein